ncbi:MAG: ATP-binding cassette domain-containing protein [Chlorobiaceae bacterium]|nr:ATP-binding cassette domain-containing protein [Chlorobiaceae bacterium]
MVFSRRRSPEPARHRSSGASASCSLTTDCPALEMQGLSFSYPGSAAPVFEHLDLSLPEGGCMIIRGASGCGKSTLLRLACRLSSPASGRVLIQGSDISAMPPSQLRSRVCLVSQIPQMVDGSVKSNLLLPFTFAANAGKQRPLDAGLMEMLMDFHLPDISLEQSAVKLSVGQKQRLALMRALLPGPELLLLDEPTSSLDRESTTMVFSIIERFNAEGKTIMLVTHDEEAPSGPRTKTLTLVNGKLIET